MTMNSSPMSVHITTLGEGLGTVRTLVRLLTRMRPPVLREGAEITKPLLTLTAMIWAFTSVNALMRFQGTSLDEGFRADSAPVTPTLFALVTAEMRSEAGGRFVAFRTFRAA